MADDEPRPMSQNEIDALFSELGQPVHHLIQNPNR